MTDRRFLICVGLLLAIVYLFLGCSGGDVDTELTKLTKKAESGDAESQYTLGWMYARGEGVPKDATKAVEWWQKSAAQGNAKGQNGLGTMYERGEGVPKDAIKAVELYQKAAEQGWDRAQHNLGRMYARGEGVPNDVAKALEWYEKAAAQGNANSQTNLGWHYANGRGVPKDAAKAMELYQKAAVQGNAGAQFNIGKMYYSGEDVTKDYAKAAEWYQKAAAQEDTNAQYSLGWLYEHGEGVPKDAAKAVEWYQKAATKGNIQAQLQLARMYYGGEGVPRDMAKTAEWCQKAAAQGDTKAQFIMGMLYKEGEGVDGDRVLAYAWSNLAASKGSNDAKKLRDAIILTPSRRAEAERLSSKWKQGEILAREGQTESVRGPASDGALSKAGTGTAFFINTSGQAITNHHIVDGCKEVRAEGRDGVVKVVTTDAVNDISLIQIPGTVNAAAAISSDPAKLRQGEDIVVFGFPLNFLLSSGGNLTPGVVSALTGLGNSTNQIQITAPIQPGSSGSPVLNKKGEVVGMASMKLSDSKMARATGEIGQNVNFAVSGLMLKTFLDAHKVDYRRTWIMSFDKSNADLADEARKWTLVVECWK